jgi:adenosylhomocysteine nucleosidase
MPKVAIVAALEREVKFLIKSWRRTEREHQGRKFTFFGQDEMVLVCGGIGVECARRAAEAVITLYQPERLESVGFAGALDGTLRVGDIFRPAAVIDARDGSRIEIGNDHRDGVLVTFMAVAGVGQKAKLAQAYNARAVDMEAAGVFAAAQAHGCAFGATKVISDDVDFEMPQMAGFIGRDGRFKTASFVAYAAVRPWLWGRVVTLARNSSRAAKTLGKHLEHFRNDLSDIAPASRAAAAVLYIDEMEGENRR